MFNLGHMSEIDQQVAEVRRLKAEYQEAIEAAVKAETANRLARDAAYVASAAVHAAIQQLSTIAYGGDCPPERLTFLDCMINSKAVRVHLEAADEQRVA